MNCVLDGTLVSEVDIFDSDVEMSYADVQNVERMLLNKYLSKKLGVQQGICILMERGAKYIMAVFAAWRAGFYVVPLNTAWPIQKNLDIINRIKPACVLLDDLEFSESIEYPYCLISDLLSNSTAFCESETIGESHGLLPSDVAYVIFTSGSTGEPKGVVVSAFSFRSYIDWTKRHFSMYSDSKRLLLTSELTFDITMGDIAFALAFGTAIGVAKQHTNIPSVLALIMKYEIDVLYSVPTTHLALVSFAKKKRGADMSSIQLVLSGGDKFPWQLVDDYSQLTRGAHFYNVYGPTEVTINCFAIRLDDKMGLLKADKSVPIGYCFDSLDYVFLNEAEVPCNEGELCVTGPQMMMGYHGDIEKTEAAFIRDPRIGFVERKLYKTGDVGYIEDGLVFLKGRIDGLIKIKGYRVHPDEVSKAIDTIYGVDVSAVVASGSQTDATLIAFIRPAGLVDLDESMIASTLEAKIPSYIMPSRYMFVDVFPLNQSGKIDKKALKDML